MSISLFNNTTDICNLNVSLYGLFSSEYRVAWNGSVYRAYSTYRVFFNFNDACVSAFIPEKATWVQFENMH